MASRQGPSPRVNCKSSMSVLTSFELQIVPPRDACDISMIPAPDAPTTSADTSHRRSGFADDSADCLSCVRILRTRALGISDRACRLGFGTDEDLGRPNQPWFVPPRVGGAPRGPGPALPGPTGD